MFWQIKGIADHFMLSEKCFGKNKNKCEKKENGNFQLLEHCIYVPGNYTGGALIPVNSWDLYSKQATPRARNYGGWIWEYTLDINLYARSVFL